MATTYYENIQQLYVAYFNRPADKAGLEYWETVVEAANGSTAAVSAEFAKSTEYKTAYANMTNEQIVDAVYHNLFGRAAEADGKAYWAKLLTDGAITIDNVVAQVAGGALTTDKEAFENKVAYAQAFTAALDTDAEIAAYAKGGDANVEAKALVSGITTDATLTAAIVPATLNAAVAKVVASVTEFTLDSAVANVLTAQEAKHDMLVGLIDDDAVAAALDAAGIDADDATDADVLTAVADVKAAAYADINLDLGVTGFETKSASTQAALISVKQAELADALAAKEDLLADAEDAVADVDGLGDAIALAQATQDSADAAAQTAALAKNTTDAAVANLATLTGKTVVYDAVGHSLTIDGDAVFTYSATKNAYTLVSGATETAYKGITAALTAANANLKADATAADAADAALDAATAADILDSADDYALLGDVAAAMVFTNLADDELPTYEQIKAETAIFADKMEALDAKAAAAGNTDYAGYLASLKTSIGSATDVAGVKALTATAVSGGYISSADKTAIDAAAATTPAAAATAVDTHNWQVSSDAFDDAVAALLASEGAEADIGVVATELTTQQDAVEAAQDAIDDFADVVAAYNHAQELGATVKGADATISAAIKVITNEGFAAPVIVNDAINLSTSKDDIFIIGSSGAVEIRSMGVLGKDVLFVGHDVTYNDTAIGSGTGQTALNKAGDNSVLEFFLKETSTGVDVIVETKAFGSSEAGTADLITIHLVGVDMADLTVDNGFITAA